jgi:hypothetical protein
MDNVQKPSDDELNYLSADTTKVEWCHSQFTFDDNIYENTTWLQRRATIRPRSISNSPDALVTAQHVCVNRNSCWNSAPRMVS